MDCQFGIVILECLITSPRIVILECISFLAEISCVPFKLLLSSVNMSTIRDLSTGILFEIFARLPTKAAFLLTCEKKKKTNKLQNVQMGLYYIMSSM